MADLIKPRSLARPAPSVAMDMLTARCLLLTGADLAMADINSCTALHYAVMRGDMTIVQSVLEHMAMQADADLNAVDDYGQTALTATLDHIIDPIINKKHQLPASACVALIEAGHNNI